MTAKSLPQYILAYLLLELLVWDRIYRFKFTFYIHVHCLDDVMSVFLCIIDNPVHCRLR